MIYAAVIFLVIAIGALGAVLYRSGANTEKIKHLEAEKKQGQEEQKIYAKIDKDIDGLPISDVRERLHNIQNK